MNSKDFAKRLKVGEREYLYFDIQELESRNIAPVGRLPFSIRILVENLLRHLDHRVVREAIWPICRLAETLRCPAGDSLPPRPGADAGFHRRPGGG
jgi:aconitase A